MTPGAILETARVGCRQEGIKGYPFILSWYRGSTGGDSNVEFF